jgi:O-antigen ligase
LALATLLVATALRLTLSHEYRMEMSATATLCVRSSVGRAGLGLLLWMSIGVLWSIHPLLAAYQAVMTTLMLIMALVLANRVRLHRPVAIIAVCVLAAAFQGVITLLQHWHGGSIGLNWLGEVVFTAARGQGLTFNPNTIAAYLVVSHFMAVCWLLLVRSVPMKAVALLTLLFINAGILATLSRGAFAAVWLGSIALISLSKTQQHRYKKLLRLGAALVTGAIFIILTIGLGFSREQNLAQRLFFAFPLTTAVIQESPFLGVGAGNLMVRADKIASSARISLTDHLAYGQLQPAHNASLTLWAEVGLPGILLLMIISWRVVAMLLNAPNKINLVMGCSLLAIAVIMASEFQFWLDAHWRRLLFWILGLWLGSSISTFPPLNKKYDAHM